MDNHRRERAADHDQGIVQFLVPEKLIDLAGDDDREERAQWRLLANQKRFSQMKCCMLSAEC